MREDHRPGRPLPGYDADKAPRRGARRLPLRAGDQEPVPPLGDRDHRADRDHPAAPAREVRRPRGDQPPPGGPGHPRGGVHRHPGRRQGGVPPGRALPHPDHRQGRPEHQRPRHPLRRRGDRLYRPGCERGQPPPEPPDGVQREERHHPPDHRQARPGDGGRDHRREARPEDGNT